MTSTAHLDQAAQLLDAGRRLSALGLSPGTSGNISMRLGERMLMSPTGTELGRLAADQLSEVSLADGAHLAGPRPSKEHPLHRAFYERNPDTRAVIHLHSMHAVAVSLLDPWTTRSALPPLTPYFVMRVGQTPLVPYAHPGDHDQADGIRALDFAFDAVLIQNHGPVTSGATMDAAIQAAIELEEVSKIALITRGHRVAQLTQTQAQELALQYGRNWD